ncbi:MAG TPA: 4-alpha-glucanotransferase [Anaerolineaceae bacterium]
MNYKRSSGIILHPTSLPGPDGIGDLGPEAYRWIDFLAQTGCSLWQILPLGPTGYGDSPYQCFSAFAGNPYLVSPVMLLEEDLLSPRDLADRPIFSDNAVDYGSVIQWKLTLLDRAFAHLPGASKKIRDELQQFHEAEKTWLDDFALFMAIKESQGGFSWDQWEPGLRDRSEPALSEFTHHNQESIDKHIFRQFLFFRQWSAVRKYANDKGVKVIGDIPIFVAYDSADAWANRDLFFLDEEGKPTVVAGVPPDYFSPTGQLWGNPLYRWDVHRQTGYAWWQKRISAMLRLVDIIRLDHFRGFAGYWEVPAGNQTAEFGRWVPGPGLDLFLAIREALGGDLPIIAEDLGEITPDVIELRDTLGLPGMKIFQFAFSSDPTDPFLPHNYPVNCVAYTGTHDNDTTLGWFKTAPPAEQKFCRAYLNTSGETITWDMIYVLWRSAAVMTLAPMQDFLTLDTDARMNFPGRASGNWTWRMPVDATGASMIGKIQAINHLFRRHSREK